MVMALFSSPTWARFILQDFCLCVAALYAAIHWWRGIATPRYFARCTRLNGSTENVASANTATFAAVRVHVPSLTPAMRLDLTRFARTSPPRCDAHHRTLALVLQSCVLLAASSQ